MTTTQRIRRKKTIEEYDPALHDLLRLHQRSIDLDEEYKKMFFEHFELVGEVRDKREYIYFSANWKECQVGAMIRTYQHVYKRIK